MRQTASLRAYVLVSFIAVWGVALPSYVLADGNYTCSCVNTCVNRSNYEN